MLYRKFSGLVMLSYACRLIPLLRTVFSLHSLIYEAHVD